MGPFVVDRGLVAEGKLAAMGAVPPLDVLEDLAPGAGEAPDPAARTPGCRIRTHRVIVGVAHRAHGGPDAGISAPLVEGDRGVLTGVNRSSQHLNGGACDGDSKEATFGSDRASEDVLAGPEVRKRLVSYVKPPLHEGEMKSREISISSDDEARALEKDIRAAADSAAEELGKLLAQGDSLRLLRAVKFAPIGRDPLQPERPLNLIEQTNQTFTYLVSVKAVEFLLRTHPGQVPYRLNLGTAPGPDIVSSNGSVAAEVFAATHPGSNDKLPKDIEKVRGFDAKHRYVFFHCPGDYNRDSVDGVQIVPVSV